MQKLALSLIPLFFGVPNLAYADYRKACDEKFEALKPKIDELKKVVGCGSGFTVDECRENIGIGVGVAAVATAAGYKAGRNLVFKKPGFCGIKGAEYIIYELLFPSAYAACDSPAASLAREVDDVLSDDEKLKKYQLGNHIKEKIIADNPTLVSAAKEYEDIVKAHLNSSQKSNSLLAEFEKKYGFRPNPSNIQHCTGAKDICDKFIMIAFSKRPNFSPSFLVNWAKEYAALYPNDTHVANELSALKKVEALRKKIATGVYASVADLTNLIQEASKVMNTAFSERLTHTVARAIKAFPTAENLKKLGSNLQDSFAGFIKEGTLTKLKMGIPAVIAALLPLASNAATCSETGKACKAAKETVDTALKIADEATDANKVLSIKSLGCAERYSQYSTVQENCKETIAFTPNMKTFLLLDPDAQKDEICRSGNFENAVRALYAKTYSGTMQASCEANGVILKDSKTGTYSRFTFSNDHLTTVDVSGRIVASTGYGLFFNPDGTLSGMKIKSSGRGTFTYLDSKKIKTSDKADLYTEDLATRLPSALQSWEQCKADPTLSNSQGTKTFTPGVVK
ncbi:MAG: hypothetical protein JNM24_19525 [Bdellovibrionaceae bacterium]|nr:hypothetical protein [Pseudobdellovibrionaceae bacterium]